jgi:hypothetical protein
MDTQQEKQQVTFLILSDTHELELGDERFPPRREPFPSVDVVLHCGDFMDNGSIDALHKGLYMLSSFEAELRLVIAGNHEATLDRKFYLKEGGSMQVYRDAREVMTSDVARSYGVRFLEEGTHTFKLRSGAHFTIYVSPYTPEYGVSAFQYPSREDRFNPPESIQDWAVPTATLTSIIPEGVDVVLTHGPPKYILDRTAEGLSGGCEHLRHAITRVKPKLHCFGHIHSGYGVQRMLWKKNSISNSSIAGANGDEGMVINDFVGKNQSRKRGYATLSAEAMRHVNDASQTLFINAAIMDTKDEPSNAPWLIELQLSVCKT